MTTTRASFAETMDAVRRLIEDLNATTMGNDRDYRSHKARVDLLTAELDDRVSGPVAAFDAATLKDELMDAWREAVR